MVIGQLIIVDLNPMRIETGSDAIRPGATGLLTGVEYSIVRSIAWDRPCHIITSRTEVGLGDRSKLLDKHWVGL